MIGFQYVFTSGCWLLLFLMSLGATALGHLMVREQITIFKRPLIALIAVNAVMFAAAICAAQMTFTVLVEPVVP